jgi:uncharacterized membrane protein
VWGKDKEWDSEITEQTPDERISWRSVGGATNAGTVRFEPLGADRTRVRLVMSYEPEGALENVGDAIGALTSQVQASVEDFKEDGADLCRTYDSSALGISADSA